MATMYDDVNAICPYFQGSEKKKISCEGITDGCKTTLEFRSGKERNQHRELFCNSKYRNCEIYKMLEEKYAE